jgi:hypothetical protein
LKSETQNEARLTRYLLGEMPPAERERLEEEYFADDDAFEQMLIAEDELLDAYATGGLSAAERRRFEERFLRSPGARERVQFARSLADAAADARPAETPRVVTRRRRLPAFLAAPFGRVGAPRLALAIVVLIVAVGVAVLLVRQAGLRDELRQARQEGDVLRMKVAELEARGPEQARGASPPVPPEGTQEQAPPHVRDASETAPQPVPPRNDERPHAAPKKRNEALARRPPTPPRAPSREGTVYARQGERPVRTDDATIGPSFNSEQITQLPGVVSSILTPGQVRGGAANALTIPKGAAFIMLRLDLDVGPYHESYRAVIQTADERQIWSGTFTATPGGAGAQGTVALPPVPAKLLPRGDYVLLLKGRGPGGEWDDAGSYSFKVVRK